MKLTILTDNSAGPGFLATHGMPVYIEADINILFDAGPDNTFIENANRLKLKIEPDYIVLSHGHWDHGNGLCFAPESTLVSHPKCFNKRYSKTKNIYVGLNKAQNKLSEKFKLLPSPTPKKLSDQVVFLGEIPRLNDFETLQTDFKDETGNDDFIPDDSALSIATNERLVIISGCAHSGICNTIEYAMKVNGIRKINAVFGGFHPKSSGEKTQKTIDYLKKVNAEKIYPSHCTSLPALAEFYKTFKLPQVLTRNYYNF